MTRRNFTRAPPCWIYTILGRSQQLRSWTLLSIELSSKSYKRHKEGTLSTFSEVVNHLPEIYYKTKLSPKWNLRFYALHSGPIRRQWSMRESYGIMPFAATASVRNKYLSEYLIKGYINQLDTAHARTRVWRKKLQYMVLLGTLRT